MADGVVDARVGRHLAPGATDEDTDNGFRFGGWTWPYWHDDMGRAFGALMQDTDAFLLGRRTYVLRARAEPERQA